MATDYGFIPRNVPRTKLPVHLRGTKDRGVRVWRNSPEDVCLQFRHDGRLTTLALMFDEALDLARILEKAVRE